jgi:hypothetical protein
VEEDITDDADALKADIAEKQRKLAVLQIGEVKKDRPAHPGNKRARTGFQGKGKDTCPPLCTCGLCGKKHPGKDGGKPEDSCFQTDIAAERRKLDELEAHKKKQVEKSKDLKERQQKQTVNFIEDLNKSDQEYSRLISISLWNPDMLLSHAAFTTSCLNVRQRQPAGPAVDSGSPVNISNDASMVNLTLGPKVLLEGISEGTTEVQSAEYTFTTLDSRNRPIVFKAPGKGLYYPAATSNILSLSLLLTAGFKVDLEAGRLDDPEYGGTITCPDGIVIAMIFSKGVWRLPTLTPEKANDIHHANYLLTLLNMANEVEPLRESAFPSDMSTVETITNQVMQV